MWGIPDVFNKGSILACAKGMPSYKMAVHPYQKYIIDRLKTRRPLVCLAKHQNFLTLFRAFF